MTTDTLMAGRAFLDREGRLIERRLAAVHFDGADPSGVVDTVRAYRNPDGGFGHGLEPDKRCPDSLPIDVESALEVLLLAGGDVASDGGAVEWSGVPGLDGLVLGACDWLGSVAAPDGALPLSFPVMERYPRAEHWSDWTYAPALNPTAGLAGRLHRMGVTHPWLSRASDWCWARLESGFDEDAHALAEVTHPGVLTRQPVAGPVRRLQRRGPPRTGSPATSSQTAAGPSPGNRQGSPPLWSGVGSRLSVPCARSGPTVGSERLG